MFYETILSFISITLLGGWMAERWRRESWLVQKRYERLEHRCKEFEQLIEEIASLLTIRIYQTKKLITQLQNGNNSPNTENYRKAIVNWNESLVSFYVRLKVLADYSETLELERNFHTPLREISDELSRHLKNGRFRGMRGLTELERDTHSVQIAAQSLISSMLNRVEREREAIGQGVLLAFEPSNFRYFTTLELFIALFRREINRHSIFRSPVDSTFPFDTG